MTSFSHARQPGIDSRHGLMNFEISDSVINGHFTTASRPQESWSDAQAFHASFDVFGYSLLPLFPAEGATLTLVPPDGTNVPPPHRPHPTEPARPLPPSRRPKRPRRP